MNDLPEKLEHYSSKFNEFVIKYLLDKNPISRPSSNELLQLFPKEIVKIYEDKPYLKHLKEEK